MPMMDQADTRGCGSCWCWQVLQGLVKNVWLCPADSTQMAAGPPGTTGSSRAAVHLLPQRMPKITVSLAVFISKTAVSHLLPGCCMVSSPPDTYTVPVPPYPFLPSPCTGITFISQRSLSTLSGGKNSLKFAHQKEATSAIGKINKN